MANPDPFFRPEYGKLTRSCSIPVDERFESIAKLAKAKNFDFNEWARRKLYSDLGEVIEACGLQPNAGS